MLYSSTADFCVTDVAGRY